MKFIYSLTSLAVLAVVVSSLVVHDRDSSTEVKKREIHEVEREIVKRGVTDEDVSNVCPNCSIGFVCCPGVNVSTCCEQDGLLSDSSQFLAMSPFAFKGRNFRITVDNSLTLYIDGVLQTSLLESSNWQIADSVPLPVGARSIAVHGYDMGVIAGILASSDDDSILSNSNWKCTNVFHNNWMSADFDDSSWPSATPICANGEGMWGVINGISRNAYWIWTPNYISTANNWDQSVYCRLNIGRNLRITADNSLTLYIDGVLQTSLPQSSNWQIADLVRLPVGARSIAVYANDLGVIAGILASSDDDYILTSSNWKCTNVFHDNWVSTSYEDSSWPSATQISVNGVGIWGWINGISRNAYWIWTPNYISTAANWDRSVYCRLNIP